MSVEEEEKDKERERNRGGLFIQTVQGGNVELLFYRAILYKRYEHRMGRSLLAAEVVTGPVQRLCKRESQYNGIGV